MTPDSAIQSELNDALGRLGSSEQQQVLAYARTLAELPSKHHGTSGREIIKLIDQLQFNKEDIDEMKQAIEEDCRKIDHDGW